MIIHSPCCITARLMAGIEIKDEPSSLYQSSDCPSCGAEVPAPMGLLGNLNHYRCQCCGWQWAEKMQ